jgi:O-antigen/teichoic acid export membrane protein
LFIFAFSRVFNAAAILFSALLSALIVGADDWAQVALMHTLFTYLVFINLGINEGIGQKIVQKRMIYESMVKLIVTIFIIISLTNIILFFILIDFNLTFLLYISGTCSLLLFSLMRLYYRGVSNFRGLTLLYMFNSLLILCSPIIVYYVNDPYIFIYLFILASPIAVLLTSYMQNKNLDLSRRALVKYNRSYSKRIVVLIRVGFPIMLAGIVFELILTLDRFYLNEYFDKNIVGNIGLSLMIIKGAIMILSILNTISFKALSHHVLKNNTSLILVVYKKQIALGLLSSFIFIAFIYSVLSSSFFLLHFPSYNNLATTFISQALVLLPLSILFPLSVISNFRFGGSVYLIALIGMLVTYLVFSSSLHFLIGNLDSKTLSILVFISFTLGVFSLHKYVFKVRG